MAQIEIGRDYDSTPAVICPYCKGELHLVIDAFKPDFTQIVRSNCVHCGGEIYAGLLIVTEKSLKSINAVIQAIVSWFAKEKTKLITPDNRRI